MTVKLWSTHTFIVTLFSLLPIFVRKSKLYYPVTKPLPIAYLILSLLSWNMKQCDYCVHKTSRNLVLVGLVFGILGGVESKIHIFLSFWLVVDILLTVKGKKALAFGGVSFLGGHICYLSKFQRWTFTFLHQFMVVAYLCLPWELPTKLACIVLLLTLLPIVGMFILFATQPGVSLLEV